ncbi:hypothetical protein PoB_000596700 [Plakobranchus ocellatus]|uniref:Secreted protein n=1 Tax=Plakobranchus ocellatus TaxID=259542 RepID=A0AAV3YBH9_9GAST|nr:hypothetical protein PoB_000596700 [Plakobranchus ocellatus]
MRTLCAVCGSGLLSRGSAAPRQTRAAWAERVRAGRKPVPAAAGAQTGWQKAVSKRTNAPQTRLCAAAMLSRLVTVSGGNGDGRGGNESENGKCDYMTESRAATALTQCWPLTV